MKTYISYFLTAFFNFWILTFYLGFSVGFASYIPLIALIGAVLLFIIVLPLLIYSPKIGVIAGLVTCFMLLPYGITILKGVLEDGLFNLGILVLVPFILTIISTYLSVKFLWSTNQTLNISIKKNIKIILFILPLLLFIIYIIFYGKYWNLNEFKVM